MAAACLFVVLFSGLMMGKSPISKCEADLWCTYRLSGLKSSLLPVFNWNRKSSGCLISLQSNAINALQDSAQWCKPYICHTVSCIYSNISISDKTNTDLPLSLCLQSKCLAKFSKPETKRMLEAEMKYSGSHSWNRTDWRVWEFDSSLSKHAVSLANMTVHR